MPQTAIIYTRVSTDDQQDNYSLPSQLKLCREYAAQQGYAVIAEYSEAYTGTTLDRPELNKIVQRVGTFDVLLVYSVDRLSRDPIDLLVFNDRLQNEGTTIAFVIGSVDTSSDLGKVVLHLEGLHAKRYREAMLAQMRRGKQERLHSGKVLVGNVPPYGYDYDRERGMLVVNEAQAAVVRQIYQWYVFGNEQGKRLGTYAIAELLTTLQVPTSHDEIGIVTQDHVAGVWSNSTVARILKNETYLGRWQYGVNKSGRRNFNPKIAAIDVAVPVIIEPSLFALAREQAKRNKTYASRNSRYQYLLRSRCTCAKCGYKLFGKTDTRSQRRQRGYYTCQGSQKHNLPVGKPRTCSGSIEQAALEQAVWSVLSDLLEHPKKLIAEVRKQHQTNQQKVTSLQAYLETCEQHLTERELEQRRLIDLYTTQRITLDIYDEKKAEKEHQIAELQAKIADYQAQLQRVDRVPDTTAITSFRAALPTNLANATFEQKMAVMELLDVTAVVDRDSGTLTVQGHFGAVMNTGYRSQVHNRVILFSVNRRIAV